jgi:hypothetical protein
MDAILRSSTKVPTTAVLTCTVGTLKINYYQKFPRVKVSHSTAQHTAQHSTALNSTRRTSTRRIYHIGIPISVPQLINRNLSIVIYELEYIYRNLVPTVVPNISFLITTLPQVCGKIFFQFFVAC